MWDPVPWFVGGGAEHSPEVARLLAYAATNGGEGVIDTSSLRVTALAVPGSAVAVRTGACLIRNRSVGGERQTYAGRSTSVDNPQIPATTAAGARSSLVVARVEDPFMEGEPWQDPADPTAGPYIFTRVIPNVPAGTKRLRDVPGYEGNSAIELARIDQPASTGAITNAMITDLRKVANPRSNRQAQNIEPAVTNLTSTAATRWPTNRFTVDIPEWATQAFVKMELVAAIDSGDTDGNFMIYLGDSLLVQAQGYNYDYTGSERLGIVVAGVVAVPAEFRGTTQNLEMRATRVAGAPGFLRTVVKSFYVADVEFYEVPV